MINRLVALVLAGLLILLGAGCGSLIVTQRTHQDLLDRPGFTWTRVETPICTAIAERDSPQAPKLAAIADAALRSKNQVMAGLELSAYDDRLWIFVVDSRDRMESLIGRRTNATGFHSSNVLCVVWPRSGRPGLTHEMVHVLAMNAWGIPDRWVNEGLAVDLTGPWSGEDVDAVCGVLRGRGELPSLDDLTRSFDRNPSAISYPAAGSFVRYLRETYGLDAVRTIWNEGRRSLPAVTGGTMEELESAWLARVAATSTDGVSYEPRAITPDADR